MKIFLLLILLAFASCIAGKGDVKIDIKNKKSKSSSASSISNASVSSVQIINHQLVISGTGLDDVTDVKVNGNSLNENFSIETKSATQIIANSIRGFSFDVSKVFNLILSDASASATFPIDFSLCNSTLNGKGFDCSIAAMDKDVLSFDQATNKWKPRSINGLSYQGSWDATDPLPTTTTPGDYFIVSVASAPYGVGDWIVWNGGSFDQISNSTTITSVFGRTGAVVASEGDYNLNKLLDVDLTVAPTNGKVLKYDGTKWIAGDDLSGGGAGSITSTELAANAVTDAKVVSVSASKITGTLTSAQIADGAIVNADINAAAAIDYSKLNIPAGSIPYAKLSIADGDIPAAKISGLPAATSILTSTITNSDSTHAPDGNAVFDALGLKLNLTGGTLSIGTISGVPTPTNSDDVANKGYTDTRDALKLAKAGDTMTGVLTLDNDLKIKGGSNYVTVKGHATSAAYNLVLPVNAGTSGYVLSTDGSGNTSWVDVTSAVTNMDTDDVDEATNLYFTEARVLGTDLAGLNTGVNGPIAAADTVLGAMGKLQYQVTDLKAKGQWDKAVNDISYSAGNVSIDKKLRLKDSATNYVELVAPATVTTSYTLTFPANDGNSNQVLRTDGSGVLTWVDITDSSVVAFARSALPTCAAGEVLKSNGTSFSCVTDNAGAGAFSGTASKAVVTGAGGALSVSATSATEIGYVAGVTSAIQTQLNSKEAAITAGTAAQYLNGDKAFVTLDTSAVPENTRLYFTEPRVLATDLLGFTASNSAIVATDSILTGLEKSQGQITNLGTIKANVAGDTFTGDVTFNTQLKLKDGTTGTYVTLKAPASGTTSHTLTLPGTVGSSGQVLSMTGTAGVLAWTTPSTSATPSGTAGGDLSGTYPNPTITGLDAAKLATGVVDNTEFNYLNGVTSSIQTQLTGKQASDATLTALAGYNTNGILVQTAVDAFVGRSIAGTANRVTVADGDGVAGNPTINVSTTLLPTPVVGDIGKYLKATAANTSVWTALASSDITTALGFTPIDRAGDSLTTGTFTLSGAAVLRSPDPIGVTDVANKQYVDSYGQWTKSGSDIYRLTGNIGLGTSAPDRRLTIIGDGTTYGDDAWFEGTNSETSTPQINLVRSRGTFAARTPVVATDVLGTVAFRGNHANGGTTFPYAGRIDGIAETDFATQVNGVLAFLTTSAGTIAEKMRISSTGSVGIGTAAPLSILHINNNGAPASTGSMSTGAIISNGATGAALNIGTNDTGSSSTSYAWIQGAYVNATGTKTKLALNPNGGSVGIGTTAPVAPLHIKSATNANLLAYTSPTYTTGIKIASVNDANNTTQEMEFGASKYYLSGGNVGIGTSAPAYQLDILKESADAAVRTISYSATANAGGTFIGARARGTLAAPTHPLANDLIAQYLGKNAVTGLTNPGMVIWSGEAQSNTAQGDFITFLTTPNTTTVSTEKMRILGSGNVGIGTTTPGNLLEVKNTGVSSAGIRINNGTGNWQLTAGVGTASDGKFSIYDVNAALNRFAIDTSGNIGIGTSAPDDKFVVINGAATGRYTAAGWTHSSDLRLKHDIHTITDATKKILKLRGVDFILNKDETNQKQLGFIAQEVEPLFPEVVRTDKAGYKSMVYSNLLAPLVEAFKELYKNVTELFVTTEKNTRAIASVNQKMKKLEEENAAKTKEIAELKAYLCSKDPRAPICK